MRLNKSQFLNYKICIFHALVFASEAATRCSIKESVLKNFTKFTGKHLCQSLFFNKVAGLGLQLY